MKLLQWQSPVPDKPGPTGPKYDGEEGPRGHLGAPGIPCPPDRNPDGTLKNTQPQKPEIMKLLQWQPHVPDKPGHWWRWREGWTDPYIVKLEQQDIDEMWGGYGLSLWAGPVTPPPLCSSTPTGPKYDGEEGP